VVSRRCAAATYAVLLGAVLAVDHARAAETPVPSAGASPLADPALEAARREFRRGVEAARAGRFAEARGAFGESVRLHPHPVTLYNLALSELELGELESAAHHLDRALSRGVGQDELPPETRRTATERWQRLVSELVRIEVELSSDTAELAFGERVLVRLGEHDPPLYVPLGNGEAPREPQPRRFAVLVRPGVIDAELRRGNQLVSHRMQGAAGETLVLREVDLPPADPVTKQSSTPRPPVQGARPPPPSSPREKLPPPPEPAPSRALFWGSVGVAAAATVSTVVLGTLALSKERALRERCPTKQNCPWGTSEQGETVDNLALAADISLAVGIAAGGVAVWAVVSEPGRPGPRQAVYGIRGSF